MSRCSSNYRVVAYSLNGKRKKIYLNAKEASLDIGAHPRYIDKCLRDESNISHGFMWRRYLLDDIPNRIKPYIKKKNSTKARQVGLLDSNSKIVKIYPSIKQASLDNKVDTHSLRDVLNKKTSKVKGLVFIYID